MAARTKSAEWREQEAKMDEKGMKKSFLYDRQQYQPQDLTENMKFITMNLLGNSQKVLTELNRRDGATGK